MSRSTEASRNFGSRLLAHRADFAPLLTKGALCFVNEDASSSFGLLAHATHAHEMSVQRSSRQRLLRTRKSRLGHMFPIDLKEIMTKQSIETMAHPQRAQQRGFEIERRRNIKQLKKSA